MYDYRIRVVLVEDKGSLRCDFDNSAWSELFTSRVFSLKIIFPRSLRLVPWVCSFTTPSNGCNAPRGRMAILHIQTLG